MAMSIAPTSTRPAVGSRTPRIMLMVVVLPAPLGPSSPTISPRSTVKETSSTAVTGPYCLHRCEMRNAHSVVPTFSAFAVFKFISFDDRILQTVSQANAHRRSPPLPINQEPNHAQLHDHRGR